MQMRFTVDCRDCSRLAGFLDEVKACYPDYYARPVPAFGDVAPKLLIIGLAPGMHGANRTGRPFTGDYAGILLYQTLYKFGFATHEGSASANDNLSSCVAALPTRSNACHRETSPSQVRYDNATVILQRRFLSLRLADPHCLLLALLLIRLCSWRWGSSSKTIHSAMARFTRFPAGLRLAYRNPQG